jgi:ketosteroid isomerase-like protein
MMFPLPMPALHSFPFDAPRHHGLTSGTNMRRRSASALHTVSPALAVFLLLALCHFAWALPRHENHEIHKEIEALEQQWRQAIINNNVSQMDHLLADDYVGITSNGTVETKTQALDQRRAGTIRITKLDITDTHVRVYGDTAVVTSLAELEGSNGTSDIGGQYRYTRVYNRRLGQWKIVSFEASRMHDIDARAGKKNN